MSFAAIYSPASTPDQDQGTEMSELCRVAEHHGLSVLEYPETHAMAKTRPVWSKMLRDAAGHKFDVAIVPSLDCFARSLADLCTKVAGLHLLGIRLIAVNERIDLDPHTADGRTFLSTLTVLGNARKNMLGRNVRERLTREQIKGVRSFPCPQALKLQKQGLTIRDIAAEIGFPVSTVGAALKARSGSCVKAGGDKTGRSVPVSAAGKRSKRVRGARPRRVFPIYDADKLRGQGLSIREVAAKIDFPASTVASSLKSYSLVKARRLAAKLECAARVSLRRAELEKANASKDGGVSELKPGPEAHADLLRWAELEKIFKTPTEPTATEGRGSPTQMRKAAVYIPVTTPDQDQDVRMSDLRRLALHRDWTVLEYRERHAEAGTRPVCDAMLIDARDHRFEVVLVQLLDCFARSLAELSVRVTSLYRLGIRFVAVDDGIDIVPETPAGRMFLSDLAVLIKAEKNMIVRNTREGVTRAQNKGVHCGRPRRSFPITPALKLLKQGFTVRDIAARIRFPASTVGAVLKARSRSLAQGGGNMPGTSLPNSAAGKPGKAVYGSRQRRTLPITEASDLRNRGWTIRAVAAEIGFPVSTVAAALKADSLDSARWIAERAARLTFKRTKLKKADPSLDAVADVPANPEPQPAVHWPSYYASRFPPRSDY